MFELPGSCFAERLESFVQIRIARNLLYLHLLCTGATYAQRASGAFGPMIDLSLGYTPVGLVRSVANPSVLVIAQETACVYSYSVTNAGVFEQRELFTLSKSVEELACAPLGPKESEEFAFLSRDGKTAMVLRHRDSTFSEEKWELPIASQRVSYGDFNSDRRGDLLFFGKKRAGISTLIKQKGGSYSTGPLLFPDLSVSDLQCTDLNGDGITDIYVLNWLSNQLGLYYGIGRGVFSEQVEVKLSGEPGDIALSPVTKERTLQIAVSVPEKNLVATFHCNSTGEIKSTGELMLPVSPSHVHFAEINGDKNPDIVVATRQAMYVFLRKEGTQVTAPIAFGAGNGIESFEVLDLDDDGKTDLAAIDRSGKRLVAYGNTNWSGSVEWPSTYGVGVGPKGIAVLDVDKDGLLDIEVINSVSSTLSVLFNRGNGILRGQEAFALPEGPATLKTLDPMSGMENTLLTSHSNIDKIGIVVIDPQGGAASVSAIPTGSNPYVVYAKRDSLLGRLEILARYGNPKTGSLSLSLFQQIGGGHFLEKSLRASLPERIMALTVDEYSSSGKYEMAFVTHDKGARQSTLAIALANQGFDFKSVTPVLSFPDSTAAVHSVLSGFVDEDSFKDILLLMSPPRNAFGIVYGKSGGAFRDSIELIRNVKPLNEDAVLLRDVNGDGHADLTWIDVGRNAVVTAYGRGKRRFDAPVTICSASRVTAIQIAGMKSPNTQDLILANGLKGSITIMFNPFAR